MGSCGQNGKSPMASSWLQCTHTVMSLPAYRDRWCGDVVRLRSADCSNQGDRATDDGRERDGSRWESYAHCILGVDQEVKVAQRPTCYDNRTSRREQDGVGKRMIADVYRWRGNRRGI